MFCQATSTRYPSKPRLAIQVGVTGHRNVANMPNLNAHITRVLQEIDTAYRQLAYSKEAQDAFVKVEPLPPRLLSPLAEGADCIAAKAALENGYILHCPLPFPQETYKEDFKHHPLTLATFENLLVKAKRVLELDGTREQEDHAYRHVGHFVLRHADILLAVWDGNPNDTSPGTPGIVAAAIRQDIPILWIQSSAPHAIQLHDPRDKSVIWQDFDNTKLTDLLSCRLLPPDDLVKNQEVRKKKNHGFLQKLKKLCHNEENFRSTYFTHAEPRRDVLDNMVATGLCTVYRTFFTRLGKGQFKGMFGPPYRHNAECQWQTLTDAASPSLRLETTTEEHLIHSDSLGCYYADQYRGTFVLSFMLGGFAVLFALLGAPFEGTDHSDVLYAVREFLIIFLIACFIFRGTQQALHQRWLDFRLLAERFRQHAFLAPIGGFSQWSLPTFHIHGDHSLAWIDWLVRSISRAEGIPSVSFNADYLQAYHTYLLAMIKDQARYHRLNTERNERIACTLHSANKVLFFAIITACLLHIFRHDPHIAIYSTIFAATLPAFGAAFAGILSQGEFERIAHRSLGMAVHLRRIAIELRKNPNSSASELTQQAQLAIDIMSQELFDWRVIFRAKPLELHA